MSVQVRTATMVEAVLPWERSWLRDVLLVAAAVVLMDLLARIAIYLPFTPVPVTGQTFGMLLAGALLGRWRAAAAMLAYLAEGMAGLPVFASGNSAWTLSAAGTPYILGPTAGYLFALPPVAFVVGWLAERGWDRRFWLALVAMLVGSALVYVVGVSWLAHFVGADKAFALGALPYIPGDVIKSVVAAAILPSGWQVVRSLGLERGAR